MAVVFGQLFTSIIGGYAFGLHPVPLPQHALLHLPRLDPDPICCAHHSAVPADGGHGLGGQHPSAHLPLIFTAYGTFLMRQFFVTLPRELEEAAFIDGASRWTVMWRIYVPLSMPAIGTLAAFAFLYAWNSFVWPFIVISTGNTDAQVLTVALQQFGGRAAEAPQLVFAGVAIAVIFPIAVFVILQRYFVENVASSGIK